MIAAIWGVESDFGRGMGKRPLVQSLTTLACEDSRRPAYFRGELMATLKIADRGDIPLDKLKGSWAGAFGQTQFMPSTFLRLAVDLDGTGRDIVDNAAAALGSTANYLPNPAGDRASPGALRSSCPPAIPAPRGARPSMPMSFWAARGHHSPRRQAAGRGRGGPSAARRRATDPRFSSHTISMPSTPTTPPNPMRSRSPFSPSASPAGPPSQTPWPTDDPGLSRAERRELQDTADQHGYDVGAPDGAIGAKTQAAIADFRASTG